MHKRNFLFRISLTLLFYPLSTIHYPLTSAFAEVKIVAIVNNEIITQKDLSDFINFTAMQYSKDYSGRELEKKIEELKPELLNKLIEDCLILQEARRKNLIVDEARVKARIEEIKREYRGDAVFQAALDKQGIVQADLEKRIRDQMLMFAIIQQEVRDKIIVRPEEVTDFYNHHSEKFVSPEERQVLAITLDSQDLADSFSYHFRAGQKLEDLATRYPFTINKISAARAENLKKEIEEAVFKLGPGEVSPPLKIDQKYYVFKLENIVPAKKQTLSEAQEQINSYLFETKMQTAFEKWLEELRGRSYIKIMEEA